MKKEFEFEYRPSAEDYVKFAIHQTRKSNFVSALLLVTVYALVVGSETGWNYGPASLAKWLFPFALSVIFIAWIRSRSLEKIRKNFDKNPFVGCDVECKAGPDGMSFVSKSEKRSSSNQLAWYEIFKIGETKHAFYVHVMESMAYIIPKHVFADKEEIRAFRELFRVNVEEAKLELWK
ncbi:MAG: YcxB family protein [Patescibacteria group bacterium]